MQRLPPLSALRAFEAAARLGSFQRAADELHVSSTAVSHHIRHLEQWLGHDLFQRRPRPMRLTESGNLLFPATRTGFDQIRAAVASVTGSSGDRPLVLTSTKAFVSRWLVPRLDQLSQSADGPPLALQATESPADLHAGEADLAIRYTRAPTPDLVSHLLFEDCYFPVCAPHLLAASNQEDILVRYPLIHFEWKQPDPHAPSWSQWVTAARENNFQGALPQPDSGIELSEETHAIEAAILGQGIALLSDRVIARELKTGQLVSAVDFAIPGLGFYAAYSGDNPRRETIERMVQFLVDA